MAKCLVFLVLVLVYSFESSQAQCEIDVTSESQGKDPVFITKNGELWVPTGSSLFWKRSEKTIVACGEKNRITKGTGTEAEIECSAKKDFKIAGVKTKVSDIQCTTSVTGDIETTKDKCAKDGILKKIGFKTEKFGLVKYFEVCFNVHKSSVIYTHHTIYGSAIHKASTGNLRPTFKIAGFPSHSKPANSYKQSAQLTRLSQLLSSETLAKKYIGHESFLARGHLTPDADGIFKSWQHATYFYVNVAPEWQTVNAGNWLRVENFARKVAAKIKDNLEVFTGIFDTLALPDVNGNYVDLSLEPNGMIPVPKWFWKIIKHKSSGIAFVTLNNPFAEEKETLCPDVCNKHGFDSEAFDNARHGYTFCCEVSHLMKVIPNIPKSAKVKSVLKF